MKEASLSSQQGIEFINRDSRLAREINCVLHYHIIDIRGFTQRTSHCRIQKRFCDPFWSFLTPNSAHKTFHMLTTERLCNQAIGSVSTWTTHSLMLRWLQEFNSICVRPLLFGYFPTIFIVELTASCTAVAYISRQGENKVLQPFFLDILPVAIQKDVLKHFHPFRKF